MATDRTGWEQDPEGREALTRRLVAALLLSALLAAVPVPAGAADRTFSWYAELVGVDGPAATLRVPLSPAASRHAPEYPAGSRVTLVWSAAGDEVVYLTAATDMERLRYGFLVDAELVSMDRAAGIAVVRAAVAHDASRAAAGLAGQWVKVTLPVARPSGQAALAGLTASARPVRAAAAGASGVSQGIAGAWTLTAIRKSGVGVGADCTFQEQAGRLTGTCTSTRYGSTPVTGELRGRTVSFRYALAIQGDTYVWNGELDAAGTSMKGTVQVSDETVAFTAAK